MYQDAVSKLNAEIEKNKNNPYIQVVGQYLLQHIASNPGDAEKIMNKDKTVAKSLEEMRSQASKKESRKYGDVYSGRRLRDCIEIFWH